MVDVERRRGETIPARRRLDRRGARSDASRAPDSGAPAPARRAGQPSAGAARRLRYAPPPLDPRSRADTSVRVLLESLLEALRSQQEGVRRDDPDALHDFRVALRRARCLIGQLRGVLAADELEHFRREIRWLGALSGPVRDRDVLLERLASSRRGLAPEEEAALEPLLALLRRERDAARLEIHQAMGSARYRRLLDEWERVASARDDEPSDGAGDPPPPSGAKTAARPVAAVAAEAIERAWRRLLRHGRAASEKSSAEALHRVRIDGKKLRYLLELFQSAYPGVDLGPTVSALKRLQDSLGELNDATVREESLRRLGRSLAADGAGADTLLLTGGFMERARAAGADARSRFAERFAPLAAKETRRNIRRLAQEGAA